MIKPDAIHTVSRATSEVQCSDAQIFGIDHLFSTSDSTVSETENDEFYTRARCQLLSVFTWWAVFVFLFPKYSLCDMTNLVIHTFISRQATQFRIINNCK